MSDEFDLDRMKEAMKGKTYRVPRGLSKEEMRKYIMHKEYENPFKNEDWNNPGKTIQESSELKKKKILSRADMLGLNDKLPKYKKITCPIQLKVRDLLLKQKIEIESNPYLWFAFNDKELTNAIKQKGTKMPEINSVEELEEWLNRNDDE